MRANLLIASLALVLAGCMHDRDGRVSRACAHLSPGVVENESGAILVARRAYLCLQPQADPADEKTWLAHSGAELKDGVWHVFPVLPEGSAGGGLNMAISQSDGTVLDYYLTQ